MADSITIKETQGPPPKPSREDLAFALERYQARIPAQDFRVAKAKQEAAKAEKALAAANRELADANEARARLDAIIADYTTKLEG